MSQWDDYAETLGRFCGDLGDDEPYTEFGYDLLQKLLNDGWTPPPRMAVSATPSVSATSTATPDGETEG